MDEQQAEWIAEHHDEQTKDVEDNLQGRVSGTQEWKEARGEDGQK